MISLLAVSGGAAALRALGSTFNYAELRIVVGISQSRRPPHCGAFMTGSVGELRLRGRRPTATVQTQHRYPDVPGR
ncbi:hypothetical protein [Rhodococcoides fascians]|uniref:hypothetical protein n=1 Tax=Rhodococcoides fascians TaxID=1828 RepID=UPI0024B87D7A|nr:hypothetical protein [Rhodococcus fascians]MDJ0411238.1 hypothetical protein [Rhodococcus fascians]